MLGEEKNNYRFAAHQVSAPAAARPKAADGLESHSGA